VLPGRWTCLHQECTSSSILLKFSVDRELPVSSLKAIMFVSELSIGFDEAAGARSHCQKHAKIFRRTQRSKHTSSQTIRAYITTSGLTTDRFLAPFIIFS
jgi:hypothetical protein